MSSTYSTNLKLELIGTGDQSGTWGTTTNTNLGTLIEEAIVGYGNPEFSSDANLTISISNGATSAARCAYLNVTSAVSLTATRDLIVPTINKPYYVRNNTTGSQSIRVKTAAGTGITIPNGSRALVFADSTNVVSAVDWMNSLTLGTALAITSGGTGLSAAGSSGTIPQSNGSAWTMTAASSIAYFASGTRLLFQQTSAPTGWTKESNASYNDAAMRIVTGSASTGGSTAFTSVFGASVSTGSYTLTTTDIPSHSHSVSITSGNPSADHTHSYSGTSSSDGAHTHTYGVYDSGGSAGAQAQVTLSPATNFGGTTSSDGAHTHTYSGTTSGISANHTHTVSGNTGNAGSGGGHTHSMSMNIKYVDCIVGVKD